MNWLSQRCRIEAGWCRRRPGCTIAVSTAPSLTGRFASAPCATPCRARMPGQYRSSHGVGLVKRYLRRHATFFLATDPRLEPHSQMRHDDRTHSHSVGSLVGPYPDSSFLRTSRLRKGGINLFGTARCSHTAMRSPPDLDPAGLPRAWPADGKFRLSLQPFSPLEFGPLWHNALCEVTPQRY